MMKIYILPVLVFSTLFASAQVFLEKSNALSINQMHIDKHLIGGGAAWFDANNDGFEDFYVTGGDERDQLYLNQKNGTFVEIGLTAGLGLTDSVKTVGVVTGDIDNDGDRDIFVTTDEHSHNLFFKNNGNNTFTELALLSGINDTAWSTSAAFGDYNLDGYIDIYVDNYAEYNASLPGPFFSSIISGQKNYLYKNNGNGTFTEVANTLHVDEAGTGLVVVFTDYDNDDDVDIYIGNDNGIWTHKNVMYRNEYPLDSFTDVSVSTGLNFAISSMGFAVRDYNEDQLLDYHITGMLKNILAHNNGNGTFSDSALSQSITMPNRFCWGTLFLDYNNDTYPDLYVAAGHMMGPLKSQFQIDQIFKNDKGNLSPANLNAGVLDSSRARGATSCDYDLDGDIDLLVVVDELPNVSYTQNIRFYENTSAQDSNWINVKLEGTLNNRDGFGTKIKLVANGRTWLQECAGGSSFLSQNSSVIHFGLGKITKVDTLELTWLGGLKQKITNLNVNQTLTILEGAIYTNDSLIICDNDSISIGNEFRTTAGLYFDSLSTSLGKDSIVMTYLLLNNTYNTKVDTAILIQDSILVFGKYYSQAGVYVDSFNTQYGCDSLTTVTISIDSSNISTLENKELGSLISVYPNPANSELKIKVESEINVKRLCIINTLGKEMLRKENNLSAVTEIYLSEFEEGVYILELDTEKGVFTKKIIVYRK